MEVQTSVEGTKAAIVLVGSLTVNTAVDLQEAIGQLPSNICEMDIDLSGVSYMASAGIRVLVAALKLMTARGGTLRLLHPCDDVVEVLDMTGLSNVFTIER